MEPIRTITPPGAVQQAFASRPEPAPVAQAVATELPSAKVVTAVSAVAPALGLSDPYEYQVLVDPATHDVIYRTELDFPSDGVQVIHTLTRSQPPMWEGYARRVDKQMLAEVAWPVADMPLTYVCGPTSFVESVATILVGLGYPAGRIRTERFGATGR